MNASLFNRDWNVLADMSVDQSSEALMREIVLTVLDFNATENIKKFKNTKYKSQEPWFTIGIKKVNPQMHQNV